MRQQEEPRAKGKAFLPRFNEESKRLELSTYRIDGLEEVEVWAIGRTRIEAHITSSIKARCDLPVGEYQKLGLEAEFNNNPPRHVDIIGWPDLEEERLSIMNRLCYAVRDSGQFIDKPEY